MTRLPADIQTQLAAAALGGVEYSSTTTPHGTVTGWCGLANSEDLLAVGKMLLQLGARLAMVSALQPPVPEEEEDESDEGASDAAKPEKEAPKTFGGTAIDSRIYFQDFFYLLTPRYTIHRLLPDGLWPMPLYSERHEVLMYANYICLPSG